MCHRYPLKKRRHLNVNISRNRSIDEKTTFLCHLVSMMREELEGVAAQLKGHSCQLSFSRTKVSFFSSFGRDFLTQKSKSKSFKNLVGGILVNW